MDASAHKLHTIGVTDNAGDVPQSVRANAANAEQLALNRLFGLNLPATANDQIGPQISRRIFGIVGNVYASMDAAGLSELITNNVRQALQQVEPRAVLANNDQRRIQAVAKAAYESVPQDLLERFALVTLPARISMDAQGQPTGFVELRNVTLNGTLFARFRLNMNAQFWKLNERTNATQDEIERRIIGQTPAQVGIDLTGSVPPGVFPAGYTLSPGDAFQIASATDVRVTERPEGLGNREYQYGSATPPERLNVNADKMLSESTDADAPRGLQNRPIFTFTGEEIQRLLEHRGKDGSYPYWKKYVTAGASVTNPFNTLDNLTCNYPNLTPPVVIAPLGTPIPASEAASEIVRIIHRAPTRTDPVGTRQITLVEAQRDVHRKMNENRAFIDNLRTGSENAQGAIVAASIALNDQRIYDQVSGTADQTKAQNELNQERGKLEALKQIKALGDLKLNLRIPTLPNAGGGTTPATFELIANERAALNSDFAAVGTTAPSFTSRFCQFGGGFGLPVSYLAPNDRRDAQNRIQQQLREVSEELGKYEEIQNILIRIQQAATASDTYNSSARLSGLVSTAGAVNRPAVGANFNNVAIAEEIKNQTKLGTEADIESSIKRREEALNKIRNGGDRGDVLQQKIFEAHFRNQGLSAQEAQRSANYLYAKSLVDNELRSQIDTLHEDLFGDHDLHGALDALNPAAALRRRKDWTVVSNIARSVGMAPRYTPHAFVPFQGVTTYDWQTRSYPQLISAYYSFKKLYEGSGPAYCNSPGSSVYRDQMHSIAVVLSDRHVMMLINDFGNDLPDKDRGELGSRKTLSLELLEKMLTGEAPDKYKVRIDHILGNVDGATHRYRRALFGTTGALAGMTVHSAKSLGSGTLSTANAIKDHLWTQKKNYLGFAALTALGGPLGAALFVGYKLWNSPKTSNGGGHH